MADPNTGGGTIGGGNPAPAAAGPTGNAQTHGLADALGVQSDYDRSSANSGLFAWQGPSQSDIAGERGNAMSQQAPSYDTSAGGGMQAAAQSRLNQDPNIQGSIASQQQGQQQLGSYYQNMMNGNGPSVAEQQLKAGEANNQAASLSQAMALQHSAKGQGMAGAAYNAQSSAADALANSNSATNQQAAQLRAGEQQQAAAGLGTVLNQQQSANLQAAQQQASYNLGAAGTDLTAAGQQQSVAQNAAALQMQQNVLNQQMGLAYSGQSLQQAQDVGQLGTAQAADYQQAQAGNQAISQQNTDTNTGLVGGIMGAIGGGITSLLGSDMTNKTSISPVTQQAAQSTGQSIVPYGNPGQGVGMAQPQGLAGALAQNQQPAAPNQGINTTVQLNSSVGAKTDVTPAGGNKMPDYTSAYAAVPTMKLASPAPVDMGGGSAAAGLGKGASSLATALGGAGKSLAKKVAGSGGNTPTGAEDISASGDKIGLDASTGLGGKSILQTGGMVGGGGITGGSVDLGPLGNVTGGGGNVPGGAGNPSQSATGDYKFSPGGGLDTMATYKQMSLDAVPYGPGSSTGFQSNGAGTITSDRRAKLVVPGGHTPADSFLETLSKSAATFRYKDPSMEPTDHPHGGKYLGVMAQAVEKGPTGDTLVEHTPRGLALNVPASLSAALAGLGRLNERLHAVERVLPKKKGKK